VQIEIIAKSNRATTTTSADVVELNTPSIVRLNLDRSQVAAMERDGDDLILRLTDGSTLRIDHFYQQQQGVISDLVLRDDQGAQWLAHPAATGAGRFTTLGNLDELLGAGAGVEGASSSFILPAVLGVAGVGGLVAAVSGGGNGGNRTPEPTVDTQAPGRPAASFSTTGSSVSGTGEPGAIVRVVDAAGNVIGTGTVGADGSFSVPVNPPQTNGQPVTITQSDPAGNVSPGLSVSAPDMTPPTAPIATLDGQGTTITGSGEVGATVTVRDAAGQILGTAVVGAQGSYSLTLTTPQTNGGTLTVTQTDAAGNVSPETTLIPADTTAPAAPAVTLGEGGTAITGTGEPGATVQITGPGGQTLGSATVGTDGSFTAPLPTAQANGETLSVTQTDAAGNVSPAATVTAPDTTAPLAPTATINTQGTSITGTGEAGATVTVRDAAGQTLGQATVDAQGNYTVALTSPQANGGTLSVTQADAAGNVSPQTTLTPADTTAPAAPVVTLDQGGTIVTGTGEPGATVQITGPGGQILGTTTVGADGSFSAPLSTAQANGETLSVSQTDAAGNVSPAATVTAPDTTAPLAPTATIDTQGTNISGTGEAGATVTVRDAAGQTLGQATVDAQGNYTVALTSPQANGGTLSVTQADAAGNVSPPTTLTPADTTAPAAPVVTLDQGGTIVTGTAEPGATVQITGPDGQILGSATVGADGSFTAPLSAAQTNGETLSVTQTDAAGNVSPATTVTAPDTTAPLAPTATIDAQGTSITGTGEAGATVTVRDAAGQTLGQATVDAQGNYTVALTTPQANGGTLSVVQSDVTGNASPVITLAAPDITPPAAPIASVSADGTTLTGTGEAGATIGVTDSAGQPIGTATVGADGSFSLTLPAGVSSGQALTVVQTDAAGNISPAATIATPDLVAPAAPTALLSSDGTSVSGTGEPGATVQVRDAAGSVIATVQVSPAGTYDVALATPQVNGETLTVIQSDAAGNASPPAIVTAPDITPPAPPTAILSADGTAVYGNGEAGAIVRVVDANGTPLGTAVVGADTSFTLALTPPQTNGQTLTAVQSDAAGNISPPSIVGAPDVTAPGAPVATVSPDGTIVTGTGEPFATVTVRQANGTIIGQVVAGADGGFAIPLSPVQSNGETLSVDQSDRGGNLSPSATLTAPDITAPTGLTAAVSGDGSFVTGTGEAGASVTIRDAGGTVIGTATVGANGVYSATLNTPQTNGETLQVTQADAAGNVSAPTTVIAPDTTPPLAPTGTIIDNGATLTGTGEAGATVTVRAADGSVIGTGPVGADGNFSVTLIPAQTNGETLQLVQSDAAGNASPIVTLTAPDTTAPTGLTAAISADGAIVTGQGEVGATVTVRDPAGVTIGTAQVDADGSYAVALTPAQRNGETLQVVQADATGNVSTPVTPIAPDLTAPAAPLGALAVDGTVVTGTGEAGATVTVRAADGTVLGSAVAAADGSFAVPLVTPQVNGQLLSVVQADAAGNVSPPLALTALDTTPPTGLTATLDAAGTIVSGQAEAGATVTVRDPAGQVIGTGTASVTGAYALVLTTPQLNGQVLQVTQADGAGNPSAPVAVTAPDLTAPDAPLLTLDATGTTASGTGEVGATVTIRDVGGSVIGTTVVAADGSFAVALTPAQGNGGTVSATLSDAAGNVSPIATVTAPDVTPPAAPLAALDPTGTIVTGIGEAGATVTVRDAGGNVLGSVIADPQVNYAITLATPQIDRQVLTVIQADATGNLSTTTTLVALDQTPPAAPVAIVSADGVTVSGTGEIGATVTITDPVGLVLATVPVGADGGFTVTLAPPLTNGQVLTLTQADAAGNVSVPGTAIAPDLIPNDTPPAPTAIVALDGASVTGTGQPDATITVRDATGTVIGTTVVAADGLYTATLTTPQLNGEVVRVTQTDAEGDVSPPASAIAPDLTPPALPVAVIDPTGTIVSGTGEVGATVQVTDAGGAVLGSATVGANGNYALSLTTPQINGEALTVIQSDGGGNPSAPAAVIAPDLTPPAAPLGVVAADGASVTGTGEAGATVTIRGAGGAVIGTALVAADGSYTATLTPPQANGQVVTLTQADPAGNVSVPTLATAPDVTAPTGLTAAIDSAGTLVTGEGEAGATVTIRDAGGTVLGTALVAANGSYAAILTPPQIDGQLLQATQADAAGNASAPATVTAPDLTPPAAPIGLVSADGTTLIGTGEAGATVTIRSVGGAVIGTAVVAADGSFTAPLAPAQANGQLLSLIQSDPAGNVSATAQATAPDITAPIGLTAAINGAGTVVTGQGEAGATVTIRDAGGAVLGTTTVAANGSYAAILTTPQINGQPLSVIQADAAGNASTPAAVTAPDRIAPLAPIGAVAADGATLTGTGEPGATLTGTGEPGATVTIRGAGGVALGSALVGADGSFTATLTPAQANGQLLTLTQADLAGNVSGVAQAIAPDITAPTGLTAAINATGVLVTGQGEAGATVTVRDAGGAVIGTAIVAPNGLYSVTLTTAQANGQPLTVVQADGAGNASAPTPLVAPDITPPAAPTALVDGTGTIVTGTGEVGATVRILDPQGLVVGTALVGANGTYSATLTIPQANGQALIVAQVDAAGNGSVATPVIAPDITPPAPPAAAINGAGTLVTGTGEPGTIVEIRTSGGTVLASGGVSAGGTFALTLPVPQVAGETLNVGLRDAAGNVSATVSIIAPFDIIAFDDTATALVDLVPVQSNQALGNANYTALASLGLVNLDAQVLAVPNVAFTVQQGHTLDATFTYDATLNLGVASGYAVVIQRFNGTNWVGISGGGGNSTLLDVSLLGGNLVASADLGPGQYRAFVTFDNTLGVGVLGGLSVTGVDSDFTDIAQVIPSPTLGNVITDVGVGGQVDVVSPQTRVESVTLNGVTTAIVADDTVIVGQWGRLTIDRDGSYAYTPNADTAALGKVDSFTYTLFDASDGERASATLSIAIASPDIAGSPVAVNDTAIAAASFANVVETRAPVIDSSFATPTAGVLTGTQTGRISDSFTVEPNSTANVTLSAVIAPGLAVLPSYSIVVTNAAGLVVGTASGLAVAGVGGLLGSGISVSLPALPSGTYNYTVTSTNTLGTGYTTSVYVGQTVTHLDQFALTGTTPVTGELLANDILGSPFLAIRVLSGGQFVDVGDTPRTLTGAHGTLTIDEVGHYSYQPFSTLGYTTTDPVDRFTYQIVQPDGQVATARLDVAIDLNNGVAPVFPTATITSLSVHDAVTLEADVVPMTLRAEPVDHVATDGNADARLALSLMEGQGSLEDVLSRYLDAQQGTTEPAPTDSESHAMPVVADMMTIAPEPTDPLGYLTVSVDPDHDRLAQMHVI
jgi:VCBS repeat-containing protein